MGVLDDVMADNPEVSGAFAAASQGQATKEATEAAQAAQPPPVCSKGLTFDGGLEHEVGPDGGPILNDDGTIRRRAGRPPKNPATVRRRLMAARAGSITPPAPGGTQDPQDPTTGQDGGCLPEAAVGPLDAADLVVDGCEWGRELLAGEKDGAFHGRERTRLRRAWRAVFEARGGLHVSPELAAVATTGMVMGPAILDAVMRVWGEAIGHRIAATVEWWKGEPDGASADSGSDGERKDDAGEGTGTSQGAAQ